MNELEKIGRRRTVLISLSILFVSLHTMYLYHVSKPEIDTQKLTQQIIRFCLTVVLLFFAYRAQKWAAWVLSFLFVVGLVTAIGSLLNIQANLILKIPILVMVCVYGVSVYHFMLSKSYSAFCYYQRQKELR